jgi:hypothetical protein
MSSLSGAILTGLGTLSRAGALSLWTGRFDHDESSYRGPMLDRQAYAWQLPHTATAREALAKALVADGTTHVRVKAGGDGGAVWIPGGRYPGSGGPQWDDAWLDPFTSRGLKVTPWFYNTPGDADKDAVVAALAHRLPTPRADGLVEIALNPEVEWAANNGYDNDYARRWVSDLRSRVSFALDVSLYIAYSSCPTWTWFPYEGFAQRCDQGEPQHYWPANLLPDFGGVDEDQVDAHIRRAGREQPCVPILTASGEYNDAGVVSLAIGAINDYVAARESIDGLSAWECANSAYQHAAVAASYRLLDSLTERQAPDPNLLRAWFARHRRVA